MDSQETSESQSVIPRALDGTFLPGYQPLYGWVVFAARKGLTLTLFLIGSGLSYKSVRAVGIRPLMQGVML